MFGVAAGIVKGADLRACRTASNYALNSANSLLLENSVSSPRSAHRQFKLVSMIPPSHFNE